jgi:hypothetical protein
MRTMTKKRVEEVAAQRATREITLEVVEAGIEAGKQMMAKFLEAYNQAGQTGKPDSPAPQP